MTNIIPDFYILCGGKGIRARKYSNNKPKILIDIKKKPFLYWVLKNLEKKGVRNVYLCVGFLSKQIKEYVDKIKYQFRLKIFISYEDKKLGTGGAIKKALKNKKKNFFVMYGDTFLFFNLKKLLEYALRNNNKSIITIYKNKDKKYLNNISFNNKKINFHKNSMYIDYGLIYFYKNHFTVKKKSFDLQIQLKKLMIEKKIIPFKIKKKFLEIGSYHGYKKTNKYFKNIKNEIY